MLIPNLGGTTKSIPRFDLPVIRSKRVELGNPCKRAVAQNKQELGSVFDLNPGHVRFPLMTPLRAWQLSLIIKLVICCNSLAASRCWRIKEKLSLGYLPYKKKENVGWVGGKKNFDALKLLTRETKERLSYSRWPLRRLTQQSVGIRVVMSLNIGDVFHVVEMKSNGWVTRR